MAKAFFCVFTPDNVHGKQACVHFPLNPFSGSSIRNCTVIFMGFSLRGTVWILALQISNMSIQNQCL